MTCPNINLTEWKNLVNIRGENIAYYLWDFYKGEVPEHEYLQINTTPYIKSGVSELFESNPELANTVYEAARLRTLENNKLEQDIKELIKGREDIPSSIFLSYLVNNNLIPKIQEYITSIGYRHGEWNELYKRLTLDYSPTNTKSEKAKLISHELMHALSHKYITSYEALRQPDFKEYILKTNENEKIKGTNRTIELVNLTKEQLDALDNLVRIKEKVFDFIKSGKFNKNEKLTNANFGSLNYAFSELDKKENIHEFISEVFSNPILIDVLKQIPTEGNKSNLFKEFIRALKIILGFNNESIIEDIFYYSEKAFINEALKESNTKKQQAQQLYSQYLDSIFPDSKVKDIVYHGSNQKINQFEVKKEPLIHFGSKNAALQRGDVLNPVLLNIENLEIIKDGMWFLGTDEGGLLKELLDRNILTVEQVKNISEAKNKAIQESPYFHENYRMALPEGEKAGNEKLQEILINKNVGFEYINLSEDRGSVSYAVPSQKQIHILGTKQDIEGFRNFVNLNNSNYIESNDNLIKKYALSGLSAEEIGDILKKNC